jgi:pimeloyl-ACP methyl ester carboxylesterase
VERAPDPPEPASPVDHRIVLPDGRRLAVTEHGDPGGSPVIFQHGFPGSRKDASWIHAEAALRGVRIVALDRPGYGGSDPRPGRSLLDWPADVAFAANVLGIDRFTVLGVSGGGPYACACAHRLGERVERLLLICAMGPTDDPAVLRRMFAPNRIGLMLTRRVPWLPIPVFRLLAPVLRRHPEAVADRLASRLPECDREFFRRNDSRGVFVATLREAFRRGHHGAAADARVYASPWGFDPGRIRVPVRLWHGEADTIVPPEIGRALASRIPACDARFVAGEGHFSIILRQSEAFFEGFDTRSA